MSSGSGGRETSIRPGRRGAPARLAAPFAAALLLGVAGCAADGGEEAAPPTPSERKQVLLLATENAVHVVLQDARRDIARVKAEFAAALATAPRCLRLASTDSALDAWGAPQRRERERIVDAAQSRHQAQLAQLAAHYEEALWVVAREAGRSLGGDAFGTRSGVAELDAKIDAALLQLARDVDADGMQQEGYAARGDHVALERSIRKELPGIGVVSLYRSSPTPGLFSAEDEGASIAFVFAPAKDDPLAADRVVAEIKGTRPPPAPLPPERISFVQAVRRRVERGGVSLQTTEWRLEPESIDGRGRVALDAGVDRERYVATVPCTPAVDKDDPSFRALWDHVLVAEYRTALRREDTGELLATIGWQVRWNIDFRGRMRVLVDKNDLVLEHDTVLPELLAAAPSTQ